MGPDIGGEIDDEVTRVDAVRYLQGALGHAVVSTSFLLAAVLFWLTGTSTLQWLSVAMACLVSANGLSIWGWDRLLAYFTTRGNDESGPSRRLAARPLSRESLVEMKAGAVMTASLIAVLLVGRAAVQLFEYRVVGVTVAVGIGIANVAALARALAADN